MTKLQKIILDIFLEVKKLCEENDITYYGIAGTCLGAVRHGGFIPWDDDLDIAVPIEEIDRFISLAKEKLPKHLTIVSYHSHPHFPRMFVRITDNRTSYVQPYMRYYPDEYHGIFIDVMPMTGKGEGLAGELFARKAALYDYLTQQSMSRYRDNKTPREKFSWLFLKLFWFLPYHFFIERWEKELRRHPVSGAKKILFAWNIKVRYRTFPAEVFSSYKELPFEGTMIRCPADTDTYLKTEYGDYMKLPPEEKRVGHHEGKILLDVPCAEFAKRIREKRKR